MGDISSSTDTDTDDVGEWEDVIVARANGRDCADTQWREGAARVEGWCGSRMGTDADLHHRTSGLENGVEVTENGMEV